MICAGKVTYSGDRSNYSYVALFYRMDQNECQSDLELYSKTLYVTVWLKIKISRLVIIYQSPIAL